MATRRRLRVAAAVLLLASLGSSSLSPRPARADSPASARLSAGTLAFGAPVTVTRLRSGATSTGEVLAVTVADGTGSAAGWTVSATAQSATMPTGAAEMRDAAATPCAAGSTCTPPAGEVISFPSTLPMGASPPTSTVLVRATPGSGLGATATSSGLSLLGPGWDDPTGGQTTWVVTLASAP